jgi:hypothetical protein
MKQYGWIVFVILGVLILVFAGYNAIYIPVIDPADPDMGWTWLTTDPEVIAYIKFSFRVQGMWQLGYGLLVIVTAVGGLRMAQAMWISVTAGALGSATTALVSCLNRRANGFEDRCGRQTPDPDTRKERFNQGMYYWFLARPFLGATVAAVIYWGIQGGVFELSLTQSAEVAFYGFLSGLLAKTILDLLRGLLKNIFN